MDVPAKIAKARRALESGHDRKAGRLLEQAVYETSELDELVQIRDIALEEQTRKGHELRFGNWHDVLSEATTRIAQIERSREHAPV